MRTEEEIRRHVRALMVLRVKPCDCHLVGPLHSARCVAGGQMMQVTIEMLKWVLGSDEKAELVEKFNRAADEFARGG